MAAPIGGKKLQHGKEMKMLTRFVCMHEKCMCESRRNILVMPPALSKFQREGVPRFRQLGYHELTDPYLSALCIKLCCFSNLSYADLLRKKKHKKSNKKSPTFLRLEVCYKQVQLYAGLWIHHLR